MKVLMMLLIAALPAFARAETTAAELIELLESNADTLRPYILNGGPVPRETFLEVFRRQTTLKGPQQLQAPFACQADFSDTVPAERCVLSLRRDDSVLTIGILTSHRTEAEKDKKLELRNTIIYILKVPGAE